METEHNFAVEVVPQTAGYDGPERRITCRISDPFKATVHGVSRDGEVFAVETQIENIGAGGLYVRVIHPVEVGDDLLIVSRLSRASTRRDSGPLLALYGAVIRTDARPDGLHGVAVEFTDKKFLGASGVTAGSGRRLAV